MRLLILCDFDGTLTEQDVTNLIWDNYIDPNWREIMLPPYRAGTSTTLDLMSGGYNSITATAAELMEFVTPLVNHRIGFLNFHAQCKARGWPAYVVSCGLEFYIKPYLPEGMPLFCYGSEHKKSWQVFLPRDLDVRKDEDFKIYVLNKLKQRHPGMPTVFIGDGRNDFPIARQVDHVFAIKDSSLESLCKEAGVACTVVSTFDEVGGKLMD